VVLRMLSARAEAEHKENDPWLDMMGISQPAAAKALNELRSRELLEAVERGLRPNFHKPPRGRQWREPWNGLGDLYNWVTGQTGSMILDYSTADVEEMGEYPRWEADEIRGWTADWRAHQSTWDRVTALRDMLRQGSLRERGANLTTLALALAKDETTRRTLSLPRPGTGPTLAQVFTRRRS
jgi:hypothetical protein